MSKKTTNPIYNELSEYLDSLSSGPRTFRRGEIVKGTITQIEPGQMLVNIGGRTEGIVAGREMKLDGEKLDKKIGDEVLVYVINPENIKGQIELSIRRTGVARKWHDLEAARTEQKSVQVTVIEANGGGVLVEFGGGLRGFVPSFQLNPSRVALVGNYEDKSESTQKLQNRLGELIGEKLDVMVMEIDREKNRVILSEKNVGAEVDMQKREETLQRTAVGDELLGVITGVAPFGLFVTAEGLEGLVHLSEISWDKVSNPGDLYRIGDKVKVSVIGIEDKGRRVAYSIKRLLSDPWDAIVQKYHVGQVIKGEITKVVDYGAFVRIEDGLNGLIHISELSNKLVKDPREIVKEGETREVKIIAMSKDDRHLGLSVKQLEESKGSKSPKSPKENDGDEQSNGGREMARLEDLLSE